MVKLATLVGAVPRAPMTATALEKHITKLKGDNPGELQIHNLDFFTQGIFTEGEVCFCLACDRLRRKTLAKVAPERFPYCSRFIVCDTCGKHGCPRAAFHENVCNGGDEAKVLPTSFVNQP